MHMVVSVVETEQAERHTWMSLCMRTLEIRIPAAWGPVPATVGNYFGRWSDCYSGTGIACAGLEEGKVGIRVFATNMDDEGQFPKKKVSDAKESMLSIHRLDSERSLTAGDERARARRLWSNTRRSDCEARPTSRKTLN